MNKQDFLDKVGDTLRDVSDEIEPVMDKVSDELGKLLRTEKFKWGFFGFIIGVVLCGIGIALM